MKIQCTCGAKYAFDITPEMAQTPVKFVCQSCGLDVSDFVNDLIRQELGLAAPVAAETTMAAAVPQVETANVPPEPEPARAPDPAPRLRINVSPARREEAAPDATAEMPECPKHAGQIATHRCHICQKPICPKCMESFGYVCSAHCKAKAASHGIDLPVYAGQKSVIEARLWRKVGWVAKGIGGVLAVVLGFWFWYTWFGSVPKSVFSVRFAEPAFAGASRLCGKDQIVFLHGGTLARHDLTQKKEVWSLELIDKKAVEQQALQIHKEMVAAYAKTIQNGEDDPRNRPLAPEKLIVQMQRAAAAALELRVVNQNVWVAHPGKLVRYDWDTGKPAQEIPLMGRLGGMIARGDEFLLIEPGLGRHVVTHVNLASGEQRTEEIADSAVIATAATGQPPVTVNGVAPRSARGTELAGLPTDASARRDAGKALDPAKVAEQAQRMSLPQKMVLPATLAVNRNQERLLAEMNDAPPIPAQAAPRPVPQARNFDGSSLIPARDGYVEFSARLLEQKLIERNAMKAPPKKSALDGAVSVGASAEVANEMLNDMQRERGGATVTEDESRYRVTLHRTGQNDAADWTGEVIGKPSVYPLETVTVLAGAKSIQVFDKLNRPMWQATLTFRIPDIGGPLPGEESPYGAGPFVERAGTLFVIDEGVLTAFDLASGNVRWRLPTVGVAGLFFDDQGMLYVNSTTASPESIKYSRQIDVTRKVSSIVIKVDPRTGKALWSVQPGGLMSHLSGKFIYTMSSYPGDFDENGDSVYSVDTGLEKAAFLKIKRLNPKNGREMWVHFEQRAPLDVRFEKNTICLVFKKEVEVLKFLSF